MLGCTWNKTVSRAVGVVFSNFTFLHWICFVPLIPAMLRVKPVPCAWSSFFSVESLKNSVEPVSQKAKVSHGLFLCDNLKATNCRLPLHEFAVATWFACSTFSFFDSDLGLSGFSSLFNRQLWCSLHPFLSRTLLLLHYQIRWPELRQEKHKFYFSTVPYGSSSVIFLKGSHCYNLCSPSFNGHEVLFLAEESVVAAKVVVFGLSLFVVGFVLSLAGCSLVPEQCFSTRRWAPSSSCMSGQIVAGKRAFCFQARLVVSSLHCNELTPKQCHFHTHNESGHWQVGVEQNLAQVLAKPVDTCHQSSPYRLINDFALLVTKVFK